MNCTKLRWNQWEVNDPFHFLSCDVFLGEANLLSLYKILPSSWVYLSLQWSVHSRLCCHSRTQSHMLRPSCKSTKHYFPVVLLIMLYKVVLAFHFWDKMLVWPFKQKLLSSTFLFCCLLCCTKWFYSFDFADKILKCDHSNGSYRAVLSCGVVYYAVQGGSNFWVRGWNPKVWPFKWKLLSSTFPCMLLFIVLYEVILAVDSDHSSESYWAGLSWMESSCIRLFHSRRWWLSNNVFCGTHCFLGTHLHFDSPCGLAKIQHNL